MSEVVIRAQDLGRSFGAVKALDTINLEIEQGSIVSLLGPNGAGKTTFLRLLMGLLEPTSGEAFIFDAQTRSLRDEHSQRIGYMGDMSEPPAWASIEQLIDLKASVTPRFDRQLIQTFLAKHNLKAHSPYGALSKGQKKWIRAGIVLAAQADVILMDEPAEGLDPSARRDLYDYLRDYVTEHNATALVTTHVIGDIERVADDVAIINSGRLAIHASLEDLREQVREIQFPADEEIPELPEHVEILRQQKSGDVQLLWIRCHNGIADLRPCSWYSRAEMRPVSLETLYLAITGPAHEMGETS